jgi:hypothetical protein
MPKRALPANDGARHSTGRNLMGTLLKIVLTLAVALLFALAAVVTVAVDLLKAGEAEADAEPGSEDLPHESLPRNASNSVQRGAGMQ